MSTLCFPFQQGALPSPTHPGCVAKQLSAGPWTEGCTPLSLFGRGDLRQATESITPRFRFLSPLTTLTVETTWPGVACIIPRACAHSLRRACAHSLRRVEADGSKGSGCYYLTGLFPVALLSHTTCIAGMRFYLASSGHT